MKNIVKFAAVLLVAGAVAAIEPAVYAGAAKKKSNGRAGTEMTVSGKKKAGKKGKKGADAETPAPKKKSAYEKFVKAKDTQKYPGTVSLYMDKKGAVWAEFPDSLVGRRFLQSTLTKSGGDVTKSDGEEIGVTEIFTLCHIDSNLVFTRRNSDVFEQDTDDEGMKAAIREGIAASTVYSFPIKYYNADSTAYIVNLTSFFEPSKSNCSLSGMSLGGLNVMNARYDKKKSGKPTPVNFGNTFGTVREGAFNCTLQYSILAINKTYSCNVQTTLTILPEASAASHKVADSRIGTFDTVHRIFSDTGRRVNEKWAMRWNLEGENVLKVYIDTLFTPVYYRAIEEGVSVWNTAFDKAGLGKKIVTVPFDSDMNADSPLSCIIKNAGGMSSDVSASVYCNEMSQALGFRITVPAYFSEYIKENVTTLIGDVDKRYFGFDYTEEAVADVLRAVVMKQMATCLGLAPNYAGSHAYSPAQLRDPEFTAKNGFTASVTDRVLFNYIARPGDKERGVKLIADKPGEYDVYAIKWLYGDGTVDNSPEHRYIAPTRRGIEDPFGLAEDLGNDPIAAYEAGISHLESIFKEGDKWMDSANAGEEDRALYLERLFLKHYYLTYMLVKQVGGVTAFNLREGDGQPKFEALPESVQKACNVRALSMIEDMKYMDENRAFINQSQICRTILDYPKMNKCRLLMINTRLPLVLTACDLAGSTYTADEYMTDILDNLFGDLRKGKYSHSDDAVVKDFFQALALLSPTMTANFNKAMNGGQAGLAAEEGPDMGFGDEYRAALTGIPVKYADEAALYAYNYIKKAVALLKEGKSRCSDSSDAARFDCLIMFGEGCLGKYNK